MNFQIYLYLLGFITLSCFKLTSAQLFNLLPFSFIPYSLGDWLDLFKSLNEDFGCSDNRLTRRVTADCRCGTRPGSTRSDLLRGGKIINGKDVIIVDFPWMVQLFDSNGGHLCGGTIISDQYILTAAHCMVLPLERLRVRLASLSISGPGEEHEVEIIKNHPGWTGDVSFGYDIALLKLKTQIQFDDTKQPICLPCREMEYNLFQEGDITGWGQVTEDGEHKLNLQHAKNRPQNSGRCKKFKLSYLPIIDRTICGRSLSSAICSGDSGGPFSLESDGIHFEMGISSYVHRDGCQQFLVPTVFTDVSLYIDWIEEETRDSTYCTPY